MTRMIGDSQQGTGGNNMDEKQTKFEIDLKAFFPHIWELHMLSKSDANLWDLVAVLQQMRNEDITGSIRITYTRGHIDSIRQDVDVLAFKAKRPGY